jgi:hypothetical protein
MVKHRFEEMRGFFSKLTTFGPKIYPVKNARGYYPRNKIFYRLK